MRFDEIAPTSGLLPPTAGWHDRYCTDCGAFAGSAQCTCTAPGTRRPGMPERPVTWAWLHGPAR